jgi:hypothetical protein
MSSSVNETNVMLDAQKRYWIPKIVCGAVAITFPGPLSTVVRPIA